MKMDQKTFRELCHEIGEIEILGSELEQAVFAARAGHTSAENEMRAIVGDAYRDRTEWRELRDKKIQVSPLRMSGDTKGELEAMHGEHPEVAAPLANFRNATSDLDALFDLFLESEEDFAAVFEILNGEHSDPFLEFQLDGRWYPAHFAAEMHVTRFGKLCSIFGRVNVVDTYLINSFTIYPAEFVSQGSSQVRTMRQIIEKFGLRPLQSSLDEYWRKVEKSAKLMQESCGKVYSVRGNVLMKKYSWQTAELKLMTFGSSEAPRRIVIDHEFETDEDDWFGSESRLTNAIPFVRGFSLDRKQYVYADLDVVEPCEFDEAAVSRLYLPEEKKKLLKGIFTADTSKLFGDLVGGKSGGLVIMACGPPGVGKTMTAEVFAEHTGRPLYCIEVSEIGTRAEEVEKNLARIFDRATRWNAVLLFDECDIFLSRRRDDLERSAIVGIFLRLLDYFDGVLFMTTNRPEVIDDPIKSRVALRITYPELDHAGRMAVWKSMLEAADLDAGIYLSEIAEIDCDGRSIRSLVRVLDLLVEPLSPADDRIVTPAFVRMLAKHVPSAADR